LTAAQDKNLPLNEFAQKEFIPFDLDKKIEAFLERNSEELT
jgi:hypothetical protein